jgi:hypothetical protein
MKLWTTSAAAIVAAATFTLPAQAQFSRDQQKKIAEIRAQVDAEAQGQRQPFQWKAQAEVKKEKAAFLGVVSVPVAPAMREQLKLAKGIGLTVESVEKDSPADQAGIQQYDVLQKVDDQWLVNAHQLAVVIRMHKPGDQVSVSLIRQGQPVTVNAKLIEKEVPVLDGTNLLAIPGQNVWGPEQFVAPDGAIVIKGPMPLVLDDVFKAGAGQQMMLSMSDDEHSLTLKVSDGHKHLTVLDKDNNVVFNGPIDTEEQRKALPEALKKKVEKLETKPGRIQMRLGRTSTTRETDN